MYTSMSLGEIALAQINAFPTPNLKVGGSSGHDSSIPPVYAKATFVIQDIDVNGLRQGWESLACVGACVAPRADLIEHVVHIESRHS